MHLPKYSMGVGDRFGCEGEAQLAAFIRLKDAGVEAAPVWNKSNREHQIIGTKPDAVRAEADGAVRALGWKGSFYVDADHIGLKTVDAFIPASDFFTLDVADFTGKPAAEDAVQAFVARHKKYTGALKIPGLEKPFDISAAALEAIARKVLLAVSEAGKIYRHIAAVKGADQFVTEVSIDETDLPQTPLELFFILAAIAEERIPAQTIAPKFTGRFNKGVDYVGNVAQFEKEFNEDLAVITLAVKEFDLPANLKLSVHSGSDKFSIYPPIRKALRKHNAGVHLKTAGTTWLEEIAGLALSGADALRFAKEVYAGAYDRREEMCQPYAAVIDLDPAKLPAPAELRGWSGEEFAAALRHDQKNPRFNRHFRQLIHVGFKVAAEKFADFQKALTANRARIAERVTENLLEKHMKPLFLG
jgi:hypothetical protein